MLQAHLVLADEYSPLVVSRSGETPHVNTFYSTHVVVQAKGNQVTVSKYDNQDKIPSIRSQSKLLGQKWVSILSEVFHHHCRRAAISGVY